MAAFAIALAACAPAAPEPTPFSPQPETPTPVDTAEPAATHEPTPLPPPGPPPYAELIGLIPDTAEARSLVHLIDYTLARYFSDIPSLGPDPDEDALLQYLASIIPILESPWISGMFTADSARHLFSMRDYLAFDLRNVDQGVMTEMGGPRRLEAVRGRFDPVATEKALSTCAECPPPDRREHAGVPFYSWGEDFKAYASRIMGPPLFDRFGRGGRLAVQDSYVFRTVYTDGIVAMIEASRGLRPSLADLEEFRLLADAMSEFGVYNALLSDRTWPGDADLLFPRGLPGAFETEENAERLRRSLEETPLLRPYLALAAGRGVDGDGPFIGLALVHADAEAASENASLLERRLEETESLLLKRPWSEAIESVDIRVEGRLTLALLRGRVSSAWAAVILPYGLDPLVAHEVREEAPALPPPPEG